jgi:hypothetical protein
VTSEWWWIDKDKVRALNGIGTHGLSVQAIKTYASDRAATMTGWETGIAMSIVTDYRLDGRGSIPVEANDFSFGLCDQTSSEAHPAPYPVGNGGHFPLFLTSALDGLSGQRHAPAALYARGKHPRYSLDGRVDGPQSWSGHRGQGKCPLPLPGIEPRYWAYL